MHPEKSMMLLSLSFNYFFLNGKSPGGPGSFILKINGGSTQYYKGPHKKENNT
jgi:hypothetical protein